MKLSEISRTAVTTWCPLPAYSNYIAAGSIAGSLEDFTAGSKLEIFTIDPASSRDKSIINKRRSSNDDDDDDRDADDFSKLEGNSSSDDDKENDMLIGSITCADRFNRLAWAKPNPDYEMGVIAGALVDGTISLYDASKIVGNKNAADESNNDAVIVNLEKHTGPVKGLEFNPAQTNLLASAGEDSNLYIWNLKNPSAPSPVTLGGKNPHQNQSISALAWNRIYEYILATTSYNGTSVVWDLKQKRPIVPFTNSQNRKRYSSLAWNPELSTQLVTASEDDNSPVIELWDLRKAYAPVREYAGHTKGVLSVSWCPDDSNLLVSCGKDNRTLIWNPNTGEVLGELPTSNNWMYDVQWSKRPSILSTSSFDGKISVFSLQDSSASVGEVGDFAKNALGMDSKPVVQKNVFKTAPKWLQRPAGAVFGFGGRLVSFDNAKGSRKVSIYGVSSDPDVAKRSVELEKALQTKQFAQFCDKKASEQQQTETDVNEDEAKNVWGIMKILFENDRSTALLKYLGLDKEAIKQEVEKKLSSEEGEEESTTNDDTDEHLKSNLALSTSSVDALICKSVLVQNYDEAVEVALKAGRLADALILSTCGGAALWEKTRQEYFKLQSRKDMKTIAFMLNNKFEDVVSEANLDEWRDALSVIASCQNQQQFKHLCDMLAQRLENEKSDTASATLCYMLSENVEKTLSVWVQKVMSSKTEEDGAIPRDVLLDFVERVALFKIATNTSDEALLQLQPELSALYTEYAHLLSQQGQDLLPIALRYLNMVSNGTESAETAALRHRVFHSVAQPFGSVPRPPFQIREPTAPQPTRGPGPATRGGYPGPIQGAFPGTGAPMGGNVPMGVPPHQRGAMGGGFQPQPVATTSSLGMPMGGNAPMTHAGGFPPQRAGPAIHAEPPQHMGGHQIPATFGNVPPPQQAPSPFGTVQHPPSNIPVVNPVPMGGVPMGVPSPHFAPSPLAPPQSMTTTATSPSFKPITPPQNEEQVNEPPAPSKPVSKSPTPKIDTSSLSDDDTYHRVVTVLQGAFDSVFSGEVSSVVKSKKRMIENGLNALVSQLAAKNISENLGEDLITLTNAIEKNDMKVANATVQKITKDHWEQSKDFIKGIKFLLSLIKQK